MDEQILKAQYASADKLLTRISLHEKYSTNKKGFGNWIFEQYDLFPNAQILELGCGTGDMWLHQYHSLPGNCRLILSDFSEGMLKTAQKTLENLKGITFSQADIQNIPYQNESMDIVIANMMLYYVPDLHRALSEVHRILKINGKFYCATYGEHGLNQYLQKLLSEYGMVHKMNRNFTLQNGDLILSEHFSTIEKRCYEDALDVTDTDDLLDYMMSLTSMSDCKNISREEICQILEKRKTNGKIHIPKEYGIFISTK
ncbi:class I SAM-dependent methyltransferase [Caproicibacter sp.]|uniref:class I SAM-dependent methyltransferase n=1 Tax=Caproicibacter sp. TaxID=2814884 RepID=UPI0039898FF8